MMREIKRFLQNIKFSLHGLGSNKMTSFLTLLGIVIGVGSVIGLMGLGQGTQDSIIGELDGLDTDIVTIIPGVNQFSNTDDQVELSPADRFTDRISDNSGLEERPQLSMEDYDFLIEDDIENIKDMSFTIKSSYELSFEEQELESYSVTGTNREYFDIYNLSISEGSLWEDVEERCVVFGKDVLSLYEVVIGDVVLINDIEFELVGILSETEDSLFGDSPNSEVYIPYSVVDDLGGDEELLSSIVVMVEDDEVLEDTIVSMEELLMEFREVEEADFSIMSVKTLISMIEDITDTMTVLLTGIAAISLLVGGIGISNVMLITVTQRTREIGIRKAVGARRGDILLQFLSEAVVLTLIGGVFGIGFGVFVGYLSERFLEIPAVITIDSVVLAVGISVGIGILFGILPANKASKLNPIEALRYE